MVNWTYKKPGIKTYISRTEILRRVKSRVNDLFRGSKKEPGNI
jgi:hypothetical protein